MLTEELLAYLFDGEAHPLREPVAAWLASSRRFAAFVTAFRTKIRKKLRATQEIERMLDLQFELETACLLLREPSLSLVYEPQPGGRARGPDFEVAFTTSTVFMVEVTRLRAGAAMEEQLADVLGSKLGQLLPQRGNVLLVSLADPGFTQEGLRLAMLHIQQRAESDDAAVVQRNRFRDRADFFRHYQRLSEVLLRGPDLQAGEAAIAWVNPQAKYPLPGRVRTALHRSHGIRQAAGRQ
jgi:hypothetical protein